MSGTGFFCDKVHLVKTLYEKWNMQGGRTLAVAESCTGGILSTLLTEAPGSSKFFLGGIVCYSNRLKQGLLGVSARTLEDKGAVSEAVAKEMAVGVKRVLESDVGLSITGIAGPGGGSVAKPVGTVWCAIADETTVQTRKLLLKGGRQEIRFCAASEIMETLLGV